MKKVLVTGAIGEACARYYTRVNAVAPGLIESEMTAELDLNISGGMVR